MPIKSIGSVEMGKKHASEAVISAVARAEARSAGADPDAVQIELLPPTRFHPVDDHQHGKMVEGVKRDRAGRPPGAKNRSTRDMLDFIRKTLGDPMLDSARWAMHTPETLAKELGCERLEAFDRLEKIRSDLRPYFYAKQAPVDSDGKPVPGLTVEFHGHGAPSLPGGAPMPPWLYDQEPATPDARSEQKQRVIEHDASVSHGDVSHDE